MYIIARIGYASHEVKKRLQERNNVADEDGQRSGTKAMRLKDPGEGHLSVVVVGPAREPLRHQIPPFLDRRAFARTATVGAINRPELANSPHWAVVCCPQWWSKAAVCSPTVKFFPVPSIARCQ